MLILDKLPVGNTRRRTADGYLAVQGHAARVGVQNYMGAEVGKPGMSVVRVYRSPEEVFGHDSAASFANKPITFGHPPGGVSASNWRQHAVGMTGGDVMRDGDHISVPLLFTDARAISHLEAGIKELSAGYDCAIDFTQGWTPKGEAYDAVQRGIKINHVALVERGRAGSTVRVGDAAQGAIPMDIQDTLQTAVSSEIRSKLMYAQSWVMSDSRSSIENGLRSLQDLSGRLQMDQQFGGQKLTTDSAIADQLTAHIAGLIAQGQQNLARASAL